MIADTAREAVHALDGFCDHDSCLALETLHVDGGGVSDIVFAVMHLLSLGFEPRIPRLSDHRRYAFEPRLRCSRLAPLFGQRIVMIAIPRRCASTGHALSCCEAAALSRRWCPA